MKTNTIYCGDCHDVLANTTEFPDGCIDLIYIDPPFFSNKHYEVLWGDGYELRAFADRWKGGVQNYIAWMEPKIRELHRVLRPSGTMYLHCDWHANAHLRILMDEVFGESNFRNEIVWCYSGGGLPKLDFPRKHDTIFRYVKPGPQRAEVFNVQRKPFKQNTQQVGIHSTLAKKYGSINIDLDKGTPLTDWWTDINTVTGWATEKLGYPTQKPEGLLTRIIDISSNKGDIVLDGFCGCGTAIAVAQRRGRKWVGVDISPTACKLMVRRMRALGVPLQETDIIGLPRTEAQLRAMQPFEFQNWVFQAIQGRVSTKLVGDMGIDGYTFDGSPVQVKQSEQVGRNVVDNFETALRRAKKKRGIIVALSFGSGAHEEVARAKNQDGLDITLKTLSQLMEEE